MARLKLVFIISAILILFLNPLYTAKAKDAKKMVVVSVNTAAFEDMLLSRELNDILENGVIGLMSTRSNGRNNIYKPYMTLGSGQKGEAQFDCLECNKVDSNNESEYRTRTLHKCLQGNIVNLSINKLNKINSNTPYNAIPGKLGDALRRSGYKTGFIGGFWYKDSIKSPAFFIVMDSFGLSDYGEINGVFHGNKIDPSNVINEFEKYSNISDFLVVELGDMETLYSYRGLYNEVSYKVNMETIIKEYGMIIKSIKDKIDFSNTVLCILSPYSTDNEKYHEMLSPFIIYDGGKNKGIIASRSTRTPGIVSAVDFAPYVLDYFDVKDKSFLGYSLELKPLERNIEYIKNLNTDVYETSVSRAPILKSYAVYIIIVLLLYVIRVLKKPFVLFLMKFIMVVPLVFLIEGYVRIEGIVQKTGFILLLSLLITLIFGYMFKKSISFILAVSMVSVIALALDIIYGGVMLKGSVFSYDPVIGARFYGIGNEFLGVMAGCSLIMAGALLESKSSLKNLAIIILLIAGMLTGLPQFGSNAGGFITVSAGFIIFILLEYGWSFKRAAVLSLMAAAASLFLLIIINLLFKDAESHLGKMVTMINTEGYTYFFNIIRRKINMEVRLIRYTIWSKVLIALIISAGLTALKPGKYIKGLFSSYPHMKNSWIGTICGCLVALLTNDSGIVTAAVMMLYSVFSGILLIEDMV